ncbi:hypothetical protein EV644_12657 [Kribbella orskensis]|uniref:DUF7144 domain-containing protein n=1 Tax=Kribbella orskensis TaxID=2512216 RepID=A0ABY2BBE1_9ACTN|nr:hypothetical protein EV642_12943 [Kribbella sp. VKM Ac-2500]TCO12314.1 hypothetical protein EV644_12657 [Kribbella orskensis]
MTGQPPQQNYYPFWALLVIALDVFVIRALAAHGRDITS